MENKRHIGFEIKRVSNLMSRKIERIKSKNKNSNVTRVQGMLLSYLYRNIDKDIFQKDIQQEFSIRRSTVTGILKLMKEKGLIKKEPVNYDARLKKITITKKGIEVRKRIKQDIEYLEEQISKGLTEEEIEVFFKIIKKIRKNIE